MKYIPTQETDKHDIQRLDLHTSLSQCVADCMILFKGWESYPEEAQRCFANMCFQLGRPRLSQFKKSIAFAEDGDWDSVATEILDSRWSKQTQERAERISKRFSRLSIPV